MPILRSSSRFISYAVLVCFLALGVNPVATAGIVGTGAIVNAQQAKLERDQLRELLSRDDVRHQLVAMGVNPQQASERVASMTDSEVHALAGKMKQLPAGGDILGTAVFIFLVLLVTDILGYTDVFPFVKKTVN